MDHDTHSATLPSASTSQLQTLTAASLAAKGSDPVPIPKPKLKKLLGIEDGVAESYNRGGIRVAYSKYKASNEAVQLYDHMVADGEWPSDYQRVTVTEIRQLFVSKSVWHAQYVPCFQGITQYDDMLAWLEDAPDAPDDMTLWGEEKTIYHFADLKEWLKNKKKKQQKEIKKEKAVAKRVMKKTNEKVTKKKK